MRKDFKIIFTVLGIAVLSGVLLCGNVVEAADDGLVVEFEQEPLFSETNLSPGDTVTRWIKVTNNSDSSQKIAIKVDDIQECSEAECLSDVLNIVIEESGIELYDNLLTQFYNEGEVFLSNLDSGNNTQYDITAAFPETAENEYQNKTTGFDLIIGFQVTGEVAGAAIGSEGEKVIKKVGKVLGAATGSSVLNIILISIFFTLIIYSIKVKMKKGRRTKIIQ